MHRPFLLHRLRPSLAWIGGLFVALLLAGCGGGGGDAEGLSGSLRIDGSSTVYPLSEAVAEEFLRANPNVSVTVGESGTGGGFSKFLRKETAINDASRPITPSEMQKAESNGIPFIEIPVAYDGIAVTVHPEVDFVDCLTASELRSIWRPDDPVENWSEVREGFPDLPIELYGPDTASGTYDYFTEAVVGESGASRADYTSSTDDNVLVRGVSGTQGALGYFGYAYYKNNSDKLRALAIDPDERGSGASCTAPTDSTIQSGTYRPLSRPLFMYIRADVADQEVVTEYLDFYLNNADELAPAVGYVPLSEEAYSLARQRFEERVTGTLFGREDVQAGARVERVLRSSLPADTTAAEPASESPSN
jgi:phosphate transport system substrate-binding protein